MNSAYACPPNPNLQPIRAAMGLPDSLVDRLGDVGYARYPDLMSLEPSQLAAMVEDRNVPARRRFAAGSLLALVGDPRISVNHPPMVALPGWRGYLGLAPHRVGDIVQRWRHVGVLPAWIYKECPEYLADIQPFSMARYPVSNVEYRAFLEETGSPWLPSSWMFGVYPVHLANHPVWTVPPEAADAYAVWLSGKTGRQFRLPTEAEWEYAASSGDGREYPWGDSIDADHANTVESGPLCTTPVGMYPRGRTPSGIDDLGGNVEEYTADDYRPYPGGAPMLDDLFQLGGAYRIARGGSFSRYGDLARCSRRHGWYQSPLYAMGFRLAESSQDAAPASLNTIRPA